MTSKCGLPLRIFQSLAVNDSRAGGIDSIHRMSQITRWLYEAPEPWVGASVGRGLLPSTEEHQGDRVTQKIHRNSMSAEGPRRWSWYRTLTSNQPGPSSPPSSTPGPLLNISRLQLPHLRNGGSSSPCGSKEAQSETQAVEG